jgi:hypothetical protein
MCRFKNESFYFSLNHFFLSMKLFSKIGYYLMVFVFAIFLVACNGDGSVDGSGDDGSGSSSDDASGSNNSDDDSDDDSSVMGRIKNYDFSAHRFNQRNVGMDFTQETSFPDNATVYYLDPVNGSLSNSGLSETDAFPGLQEVLSSDLFNYYSDADDETSEVNPSGVIKGGCVLMLLSGYHGSIELFNVYLNDMLYIVAAEDKYPVLRKMHVVGGKNFTFDGIYFSVEITDFEDSDLVNLRTGRHENENFTFRNNYFFSTLDSSLWDADDWNTLAVNAIYASCDNLVVSNNLVLNVNKGVYSLLRTGSADIRNNTVKNFAADGMRINSRDTRVQHNLIMTAFDVNGNHDDAIQLTSIEDIPQTNIDIIENVIIGYEYDDHPFKANVQGIVTFGDNNSDWRILGNWLMLDTYHGITIETSNRIVVADNFLISRSDNPPRTPWISLNPPEGFVGSPQYLVKDNITTKNLLAEMDSSNILIDASFSVYSTYFNDPTNFDLNPITTLPDEFSYDIDNLPAYDDLF